MQTVFVMGLVASSAFPLGVLIGLFLHIPRRVLAGNIAFGAGVLVVALTATFGFAAAFLLAELAH